MNLKEQIAEHLVKNRIEHALELLQSQPNLNIHLQNDIILLQQNHQDILYREQRAVLTYEQVNVEKNKLSRTILHLTDNIVAGKQPLTFTNFIEQIPSKNLLFMLLVLEIAIGILGKLFPEKITINLTEALGPDYLLIYFSILGFTISAFLWLFFSKEKPKTTLPTVDIFSREADKIRETLLLRYQSRLQQKTDYRLPVSLILTYTKEGTSPDYIHFSEDIHEAKLIEGGLIISLQKHGHLLILGNPGAGKTTLLLELAVAWLEQKISTQIPILFNLANWKADGNRFDEWLEDTLVSGYGFSKQAAKDAVFKQQILLLLDGLDEVGRDEKTSTAQNELRSKCLKAIDQHLSLFEVDYMVICSRREEYLATNADAPVKAAILVNPLSVDAIKSTLIAALTRKISTQDETAAKILLSLIPQFPKLEAALCTPFYYNIALEVFDKKTDRYEFLKNDLPLYHYLVEYFVIKKLQQHQYSKGVNLAQHYLAFIASTLNKESRVSFELIDFQPYHLNKKWRKTNWGLGIISGLFFGIFFSLFFGLKPGLGFGLIGGLYVGIFGRFEIKPSEKRNINWFKLLHLPVWKNILVFGLIFGFTFGSIGGVVFGFNSVLIGKLIGGKPLRLEFGLINGFIFGLIGGMLFGLVKGLVENASFATVVSPYYRLKSEIKLEIFQWLIIMLPTNPLVSYISRGTKTLMSLTSGVLIGGVFGIFLGLLNTSLFKHIILRLLLYSEKKLPLRWVSFFTYATATRILEQDGGQWRFRHQILQDYFAQKWEEEQAKS